VAEGTQRIPQHWEQQMKSAPLGKRRVLLK
jgi:hypothetical protein